MHRRSELLVAAATAAIAFCPVATPLHKYAKAGAYTVTLVLFSGTGSAFPGEGAGPIVTGTVRVD